MTRNPARSSDSVPEGYVRRSVRETTFWATEPVAEWATEALANDTLHAWAKRGTHGVELGGRGRVLSVDAPVPGPDGCARWAVRHYRRGGAVAAALDDRYLRVGRPRPVRELEASTVARSRGVLTPAVVCGAVYLDGLYYRCDLATEAVPHTRTLAEALAATSSEAVAHAALRATGRLVASLAGAGVYHVDLNARNVLVPEPPTGEAWAIDLDRARVVGGRERAIGERMRTRLLRSIRKIHAEEALVVEPDVVEGWMAEAAE